jgi:TonB family protein
VPRAASSHPFHPAAVLLLMLLGCVTDRPALVVIVPSLPEQLSSLATFMCKHEQVPLPVPSRLPAGVRASDYIRQEDLDFLARKAAAAQTTPSEGPGLAEERARDAVCQVTSVESLGEHVRVTLWRNRPLSKQQGDLAIAGSYYALLFVKTEQGWRTDYQLPEAEQGQALVFTVQGRSPTTSDPQRSSQLPYNVEMTRPERLSGPIPPYTQEALDHRVEGTVIAQCIITREGQVRDCRVRQSLPYMEDAILDALFASRFKPATVHGEPIDQTYTFTIQLHLPTHLRENPGASR